MSLYFQPTAVRSQDSTMAVAPSEGLDIPALIDQLTNRIIASERMIEQKVSEKSLAKILLTENDIVLMADKISLVGQINMFDWVRDVSGNITGGIDPSSMTRIVGGKIQTGTIESTNWTTTTGSQLNLDNGTIRLGGSSAPKFSVSTAGVVTCQDAIVHGTLQANSVITNSCTVDGVSMATIASNASSALSGLSAKLEAGTSYTLTGVVVPANSGALKVGDITWNQTTGALTGGSGIAITEYGIIGAASGVAKFTIDTSGNATFSGALSAATGTFSGNLSSGGNVDVSGYVHATGSTSIDAYQVTVSGTTTTSTNIGVYGKATTGTGVLGVCTGAGVGVGAYAGNSGAGKGLYATGGSDAGSIAVLAENILGGIALKVNGPIVLVNQTVGTSIATATFPGNNKPGGNTTNTWLTTSINGTTYYIPVWT